MNILHIASVSLQFIDVPPNCDKKMKKKAKNKEPKPSYTGAMTEMDHVRPSSATIQYCTQVIIQIYTDTSVMYKNKDEQSKAIC